CRRWTPDLCGNRPPLTGENGSGKTNAFRAIRLMLDDNMIRSAYRLEESDFHRGLGSWKGHWIIISLEFEDVSKDESIQALFLHGTGVMDEGTVGRATYNLIFRPKQEIRSRLASLTLGDAAGLAAILDPLTIGDYETVFTGRSDADFNDEAFYKEVVGDFDLVKFSPELNPPSLGAKLPSILSLYKEVSFTYVQALRDVVGEFHNNRTNPLLTLLKGKSGELDPAAIAPITAQVKALNESIERLPDVNHVRSDIRETIKGAAGEAYSPSSLSIKSDLPEEADRLFQSLKLFVGESGEPHEGPIHELSLGGANLIFLTLKLLEFKYQKAKRPCANFLLIEEPEAHIHTHIQKTLFDRLDYDDTQIIYSTHSTQISEVSNVRKMNVLGRTGGGCEAFQPTSGLGPDVVENVERYLDAVRSNLLFAKSVILVEGDAEEILLPVLVKKVLGVSLDELGISLVNIRSTGFQNVAALFHRDRIRKRCSIVTDLDESVIDTAADPADPDSLRKLKDKFRGSQESGARRKTALEAFSAGNEWVGTFFAPHTFEVDFVAAGNVDAVVNSLDDVYVDPATIAQARTELESGDVGKYGIRTLRMASNQGKGWFAILLGKRIDHKVAIPEYILRAVAFAHPELSDGVWRNVLEYRLRHLLQDGLATEAEVASFRNQIDLYLLGFIDFPALRREFGSAFPNDALNAVLSVY
ncbi:MAG: AAA family ATPase, partial [Patescibacteria group bacterium]